MSTADSKRKATKPKGSAVPDGAPAKSAARAKAADGGGKKVSAEKLRGIVPAAPKKLPVEKGSAGLAVGPADKPGARPAAKPAAPAAPRNGATKPAAGGIGGTENAAAGERVPPPLPVPIASFTF